MGALGELKDALELLRAGGPLAVAVLAGWWALRKDKEAKEARTAHEAAMQATFEQMVALTTAQTAAQVKLEGTIAVLKDLVMRK